MMKNKRNTVRTAKVASPSPSAESFMDPVEVTVERRLAQQMRSSRGIAKKIMAAHHQRVAQLIANQAIEVADGWWWERTVLVVPQGAADSLSIEDQAKVRAYAHQHAVMMNGVEASKVAEQAARHAARGITRCIGGPCPPSIRKAPVFDHQVGLPRRITGGGGLRAFDPPVDFSEFADRLPKGVLEQITSKFKKDSTRLAIIANCLMMKDKLAMKMAALDARIAELRRRKLTDGVKAKIAKAAKQWNAASKPEAILRLAVSVYLRDLDGRYSSSQEDAMDSSHLPLPDGLLATDRVTSVDVVNTFEHDMLPWVREMLALGDKKWEQFSKLFGEMPMKELCNKSGIMYDAALKRIQSVKAAAIRVQAVHRANLVATERAERIAKRGQWLPRGPLSGLLSR